MFYDSSSAVLLAKIIKLVAYLFYPISQAYYNESQRTFNLEGWKYSIACLQSENNPNKF